MGQLIMQSHAVVGYIDLQCRCRVGITARHRKAIIMEGDPVFQVAGTETEAGKFSVPRTYYVRCCCPKIALQVAIQQGHNFKGTVDGVSRLPDDRPPPGVNTLLDVR